METLSQNSRLYRKSGQDARCRRGKKGKNQNSTIGANRNAFLKHSFQPLTDNRELLRFQRAFESSYFQSLKHLASLYQFQPLDVSGRVYPYNIYLSYQHAKYRLHKIAPDVKLFIVHTDETPASLATAKVYDTGTCLYYIPVQSLCKLMNQRKAKKDAELLLSVFAYLYQVAGIPFHGDNSSYLCYTYEMIEEWIRDEPEAWGREEYGGMIADLKAMNYYSKELKRKINNPYQLLSFEKRLSAFRATTDTSHSIKELAQQFHKLYQTYPDRSIADKIDNSLFNESEEDTIGLDQYLSFFWTMEGWLYEQLFEFVNSSLQEMGIVDEPMTIQVFDKPQAAVTHDLEFENTLFELLSELVNVLNKIG